MGEAIAIKRRLPRWGAVVLSDLVPGLGQALSGHITSGLLWFAALNVATGFVVWLAASPHFPGLSAAFCAGGFVLTLWLCMLVHAYYSAAGSENRVEEKPWIAALLSCFLPGLGQLYNYDFVLGIIFLALTFGVALMPTTPTRLIFSVIVGTWSVIQALRGRLLKEQIQSSAVRMFISAWVVHLLLFVTGFFGVRMFWIQPFRIPTAGMEPTLRGASKSGVQGRFAGDHIFVNKLAYRLRPPQRGDIVVFRADRVPGLAKTHGATYYVKRIVGLPGENISIHPPYVLINGRRLVEPPIFETIARAENGYSGYLILNVFPSQSYLSSELDSVQLRENEYFLLADNSRSGMDSRFWGPVPRESLVGPVTKIYWPWNRIGVPQ